MLTRDFWVHLSPFVHSEQMFFIKSSSVFEVLEVRITCIKSFGHLPFFIICCIVNNIGTNHETKKYE